MSAFCRQDGEFKNAQTAKDNARIATENARKARKLLNAFLVQKGGYDKEVAFIADIFKYRYNEQLADLD